MHVLCEAHIVLVLQSILSCTVVTYNVSFHLLYFVYRLRFCFSISSIAAAAVLCCFATIATIIGLVACVALRSDGSGLYDPLLLHFRLLGQLSFDNTLYPLNLTAEEEGTYAVSKLAQ